MKDNYYIDRELSWIKFNERVLEEAVCKDNPLFERLKFIAIFQSNYDEFFKVRVGSAMDSLLISEDDDECEKYRTRLNGIFKSTRKLMPALDEAFSGILADGEGFFRQITEKNITTEEKSFLKRAFEREIAPFIAPFIIEKKHPFPFIDSTTPIVGVTIKKKNGGVRFGFIPIRTSLPRVIFMPGDDCRFILIEDLIYIFASKVFHKFEIVERAIFMIIRNSDVDESYGLYDYDVDFRDTMSKLVELRQRLEPVEVKYNGNNCDKLLSYLSKTLFLSTRQFFCQQTPITMSFVGMLEKRFPKQKFPSLYYKPMQPQYHTDIDPNQSIISQIRKKDLLLSYPFDDITTLIDLLDEAALSPKVNEIMISLYRVATNSKIVHALVKAAKKGKRVTCLVELRARFDEANNIDWSKQLEEAGCQVIYGLPHYKVHCKLIYIGFNDKKADLAHIGTGNFNETTAKLYTDLALITSNPDITADVREVFRCLINGEFVDNTQELLVAPNLLKTRVINLIDDEIEKQQRGAPAGIIFKVNSITDRDIIQKLVEASQAGVKIKLIVRGICCIVPKVAGYTDNIEIISIVGRLLEHSRIYAFGVGRETKYYISSADFMTRNTSQRVEVAAPVYSFKAKQRLSRILKSCLADNVKARKMNKNAKYSHIKAVRGAAEHNSQIQLYQEAYDRTEKRKERTK